MHRVLGSLLSAHRIITDARQPFGDMAIKDYDNELLHMAHDLAVRLLPAFENTKTGIPYPRVGGARQCRIRGAVGGEWAQWAGAPLRASSASPRCVRR